MALGYEDDSKMKDLEGGHLPFEMSDKVQVKVLPSDGTAPIQDQVFGELGAGTVNYRGVSRVTDVWWTQADGS